MPIRATARTIKFTEEELAEFRKVYQTRFDGAAPVTDSALLRYLAIRGCEAMKADLATTKKTNMKPQ